MSMSMRSRRLIHGVLGSTVIWMSLVAAPWPGPPIRRAAEVEIGPAAPGGFEFTRLRYRSSGGYGEAFYLYEGRVWERWETDHPQGDRNLVQRLGELTELQPGSEPRVVTLDDDRLFDAPLLYLCDVGWMEVDDAEAGRLAAFLARGGMLWADDFWGAAEWENFERVMRSAVPQVSWRALEAEHPLLDLLFPLDRMPQIPARDFAAYMDHDPPQIHRQPATGIERAELRAFYDGKGRMVALASFNSDVGDGWEREAYGEWFFERFSASAYAFASNLILYALTH